MCLLSRDQAECDLPETQTTHICMKAKRLKRVCSLHKHLPHMCVIPCTYRASPQNPSVSNIRKYNIRFQSGWIEFLLAPVRSTWTQPLTLGVLTGGGLFGGMLNMFFGHGNCSKRENSLSLNSLTPFDHAG